VRRAQLVGTGLIGGSLGLALRQRGWWVTGCDADPGRSGEALAAGALDAAGEDVEAEVVFVAVPAAQAGTVASAVLADPRRRPDVVVSDVSGVKAAIVAAAADPRFIGGHPMAGSEQVGLSGADPDLFVGATWVLTPTAETDLAAFARLREVVTSLGAEVMVLAPADHDRMVAMVSHLPHLVAATLMNDAAAGAEEDAALLRLAAGGFRDMTRVAAGHPGIWPDICADNAVAIVAALDQLLADLGTMRQLVTAGDRAGLLATLERASAARRALPARATRPEALSELRVPVTDREGVLAEITSLAGALGINIYDIEIAHSAEGPQGVLLLVVDTPHAATLRQGLSAQGYRSTVRELS
jgi:prephenate dehydrogenase